ncbi:MAG: DUF1579 domain-containing protein [Anaerolineaceae bacterium]|nr:DUF1579 domain-containing protein [Anaerolineaceae bacterium]
MQGEPLEGMALLGHNPQRQRFEIAWVDTFYNGSAIIFLGINFLLPTQPSLWGL